MEKAFVYDERALNAHVYWQMVQNGFVGVACEPNCIFQVCNQVPIFGFRLHDFIYGGSLADEVTEGYLRAWTQLGMISEAGHYSLVVQQRERVVMPSASP